ncbi:MAG: S8 family serine peptidase, partial [Pyrinomonadaceae bacterium]
MIELLAGSKGINPFIEAESGVLRLAAVQEVARLVSSGNGPASLRNKRVWMLREATGTNRALSSREFWSRVDQVLTQASARGNVILYLDVLPNLLSDNGRAQKITTLLQAGRLQLIGGGTRAEFDQTIGGNGLLAKLFAPIDIESIDGLGVPVNGANAADGFDKANPFIGEKVSSDLRDLARDSSDKKVTIVVQGAPLSASVLHRFGAREVQRLSNLNATIVEVRAGAAARLAEMSGVRFLSLDHPAQAAGHVTTTSGTDAARSAMISSPINPLSLDGTGVGIAVVDSGLDLDHVAFRRAYTTTSRIVYSRDFTGEGRVDDPYGHGTHVAGLAAGSSTVNSGSYLGVAPGANLINLRVLDREGIGSTASLLSALDWVLTNHATYNIRVVNMSVGTLAVDSYRNDPLCRAVRHLVDAGIFVVAAAGNNGRTNEGRKLYGLIHAPGNEPSALTVGAANTFQTDNRLDDGVTTYSSRGPTRSHYRDEAGVLRFDNLLKPELVAPGNKLIAAESDNNLLVTQHPELDAGVSQSQNR